MKKRGFKFLLCFVLSLTLIIPCFSLADASHSSFTRTTSVELYSPSVLVEKILSGELTSNAFTNISVSRKTDEFNHDILTIEIDELKTRSVASSCVSDSRVKNILVFVTPRALGQSSKTSWKDSDFSLTLTLNYDRITISGYSPCYKIKTVTGKYNYYQGRYDMLSLELIAGQSGNAFTSSSSSSFVGTKSERCSGVYNSPSSGTTYSKSTNFQYYIEAVPSTIVGGSAELTYSRSTSLPSQSLYVNIQLID